MEANQHPPATQRTIGFLGYREFDNGTKYRGAILVTDREGKPMEFRCTAPVCPTQLQRTLYGKSLLPHILTELLGAPLISSVREKPDFLLIVDADFFDVREKASAPVIRVTKVSDLKPKQEAQSKSKTLLLESVSGKFAQLELETHWKFGTDIESSVEMLRDLFARWDLTEPFQRLGEGLQYVHDAGVLES